MKQKPKPKPKKKKQQKKSPIKKKKKDEKGPPPPPTTIREDNDTKYSSKRPELFEVKYRDEEEEYSYNPIAIEEENQFLPSFQIPLNLNLVANAETICKLAYTDELLKI